MSSALPQINALPPKEDRIPSTVDFKGMPIRELLQYCLNNVDAAWIELLARLNPTIRRVVRNRVCLWRSPDPELIKELTNIAVIKLFQVLPKFEWQGDGQFFRWVKIVTLNAVEDWIRIQKPEVSMEEALGIEDKKYSEERMRLKLRCDEIEGCLKKLNATDTEIDIFWFFFKYGYSAREISEMPDVNLSVRKVEALLARLIRQLRR